MFSNLFDMAAVNAALENPTGWRGSSPDRAVFFEKFIFAQNGYKIDLHKFVAADEANCFHSHPAVAIRWVISGGYVEEFSDGSFETRMPGYIGLVQPEMTHRIASLLDGESVSLWIRTPKTHEINLVGDGWPPQ
ncbi:MAG: hypothetical protein COA84_15035 [Robiginitomaculum sp.]|nr:MAG: hypothetical protein COA84_15035 [Robiginitomaculum sp.]